MTLRYLHIIHSNRGILFLNLAACVTRLNVIESLAYKDRQYKLHENRAPVGDLQLGFIPVGIDVGVAAIDGGNEGSAPEGAADAVGKELFEAARYGAAEEMAAAESAAEGKALGAAVPSNIDGCAEAAAGNDEAAAKACEPDTPTHAYASASSLSQFELPIPVFHL